MNQRKKPKKRTFSQSHAPQAQQSNKKQRLNTNRRGRGRGRGRGANSRKGRKGAQRGRGRGRGRVRGRGRGRGQARGQNKPKPGRQVTRTLPQLPVIPIRRTIDNTALAGISQLQRTVQPVTSAPGLNSFVNDVFGIKVYSI